jgi:uncharacterized membrane protein YcaP (DUF421 family)
MNWSMVFDGWAGIGRILTVGPLAYAALVLMLRVSGKRTLAKMNAFDLVVTVALGSTLATVVLSKDVSLLSGVIAMAVLIGMQYVVAWLSVRSALVRRVVRSEPRLLVRRGQMLEHAMKSERVSWDEVLAAIRSEGLSGAHDVDALILETDGSFSVVPEASGSHDAALEAVHGYDRS